MGSVLECARRRHLSVTVEHPPSSRIYEMQRPLEVQRRNQHACAARDMLLQKYFRGELRADFVCTFSFHMLQVGVSEFEGLALAPDEQRSAAHNCARAIRHIQALESSGNLQ